MRENQSVELNQHYSIETSPRLTLFLLCIKSTALGSENDAAIG